MRRKRNVRVVLGQAVDIDATAHEVVLSDGGRVGYDSLIVATGARFSYFGNEDWAKFAPGLKTVDDATEIRRRIFIAFEAAEREANRERQAEWMTFVIVGAGPTGVELAGALGEIAHDTLRRDFRNINPADARILLVEAMERVLPPYPPGRSASAKRQLERLGVTVRTDTRVVGIDEHGVDIEQDGQRSHVPARTVLWAAGVLSSSFARRVATTLGAVTDRSGRVVVTAELNPPDHPDIFFIGDAARMEWQGEKIVPGVAQGAIQSGRYAARTIRRRLHGKPVEPFRYRDRGDVAIIGRLSGVTNIPWLGPFGQAGGFPAWVLWLSIHLVYLIGFANRVVVLTRWGWSFLTHGRGSRLITGQPLLPELEEPIEEAGDHLTAHATSAGPR